ncbi:hypothetical protein PG994_001068 [Apiospora phragmitis]|uniref:Uncharacterized protein n=1 Tax=Apiospora phragmitis TaxID=2905665 RepID=A0ABR1WSH2_9PEZI
MLPHIRGDTDASDEDGRTVVTKVTQDPTSRFQLTMVTQMRLWSPTYGSLSPEHDPSCGEEDDEDEEIVFACIRLGFCLVSTTIPRYFEAGQRVLGPLHTHDVRAEDGSYKLPWRLEADDVTGALAMQDWSRDQPSTTSQFGGLVPCVKALLRQVAIQALEGPDEILVEEDPDWDKFEGAEPNFEAAIEPLNEELVIAALSGAMAEIREACLQYERVKSRV